MANHRHVVSSEWEVLGDRSKLVHTVQLRGFTRRNADSGLIVQLETQCRFQYPPGDKPACCEQARTILKVYGDIRNANDVKKVIAQLQRLEHRLVEEHSK